MRKVLELIAQICIGVFGVSAIFMVNRPEAKLRKWAPIVAMFAQPAWYYTTYINEQWGIFILSFLYTYSWGMGIYQQWIKNEVR